MILLLLILLFVPQDLGVLAVDGMAAAPSTVFMIDTNAPDSADQRITATAALEQAVIHAAAIVYAAQNPGYSGVISPAALTLPSWLAPQGTWTVRIAADGTVTTAPGTASTRAQAAALTRLTGGAWGAGWQSGAVIYPGGVESSGAPSAYGVDGSAVLVTQAR